MSKKEALDFNCDKYSLYIDGKIRHLKRNELMRNIIELEGYVCSIDEKYQNKFRH